MGTIARSSGTQVTFRRAVNRCDRAQQRRPEGERERHAPRGVNEVEPEPLAHVDAELGEAVVAIGHPVAHVLHRGEAEADHAATAARNHRFGCAPQREREAGADQPREPHRASATASTDPGRRRSSR